MDDLGAAGRPSPCRVGVHHLTSHQIRLLRSVLDSGGVHYGIVRGEVIAAAEHADEVQRAVEWSAVDPSPDADEHSDDGHRSERPPVVAPSRPPLTDGRRQATRWRRLSGGVLDEALVGLPMVLAHRAGAPGWSLLALHGAYYVLPVTLWGWTVGKLVVGTRVVESDTLRIPSPVRAIVRWLPIGVPMILGAATGLSADVVGAAVMAAYAPALVELRGLHDLAARTRVAESTAKGPGGWFHR